MPPLHPDQAELRALADSDTIDELIQSLRALCGNELADRPLPARATWTVPGTPRKMAVIATRAAAGRGLFHPADQTLAGGARRNPSGERYDNGYDNCALWEEVELRPAWELAEEEDAAEQMEDLDRTKAVARSYLQADSAEWRKRIEDDQARAAKVAQVVAGDGDVSAPIDPPMAA
ncbi:MAG: hypothetical protein K2R98_08420 [Gemmataceae bacterium]|nr:hypothetical protein [Gemmataceae bacterium]